MRKQMIENAAYEVATQVRTVEETIDSALAEIAELQARIMRANSMARTSYGTAHEVLEQVASAINGLIATRGAIVGCHKAMVEAKAKVPGLRTVSYGDGGDCPDAVPSTGLRIVA